VGRRKADYNNRAEQNCHASKEGKLGGAVDAPVGTFAGRPDGIGCH